LVGIALACALVIGLISGDFMRSVTVLVVFCPCAFILATPTAVAAAIGNLTKYGILIRTGDALERLSKIKYVAFDKTGTLTYGKPKVIGVETLRDGVSKEEVLRLTALAEQRSEHPLGKAIIASYTGPGGVLSDVADFKIIAGQGLMANVDGKVILAGKPDLFKTSGISLDGTESLAQRYYNKGATVIFMAADGVLCGLIALADTVRDDSKETVTKIKALGITPILLTGDNKAAAENIAGSVNIDEVRANLLPEDKMSIIKEYNDQQKEICMVGDGVNDALALSSAYAGIAMGGVGSDIAVESADAVLVSDDVKRLPYLFRITRKSMTKIRQNIVISLIINFTAIILSAFGVLNPVSAALVHNFGSVFVVVNAALLLREKDKAL
jgi:heavy metal translocating P-type ATPase